MPGSSSSSSSFQLPGEGRCERRHRPESRISTTISGSSAWPLPLPILAAASPACSFQSWTTCAVTLLPAAEVDACTVAPAPPPGAAADDDDDDDGASARYRLASAESRACSLLSRRASHVVLFTAAMTALAGGRPCAPRLRERDRRRPGAPNDDSVCERWLASPPRRRNRGAAAAGTDPPRAGPAQHRPTVSTSSANELRSTSNSCSWARRRCTCAHKPVFSWRCSPSVCLQLVAVTFLASRAVATAEVEPGQSSLLRAHRHFLLRTEQLQLSAHSLHHQQRGRLCCCCRPSMTAGMDVEPFLMLGGPPEVHTSLQVSPRRSSTCKPADHSQWPQQRQRCLGPRQLRACVQRPRSSRASSTPRGGPGLRIPSMRRKNFSAHFALSSRRLKVAVVSSFRGTSRQLIAAGTVWHVRGLSCTESCRIYSHCEQLHVAPATLYLHTLCYSMSLVAACSRC
jgi:hypothetical protein